MFYDENLMNDEILGVVWKLANNIPTENIGNHNLPRICTELNSWVDIAVVPHRRLSLRTSSTLINGTAMLYQQNMRQLLDGKQAEAKLEAHEDTKLRSTTLDTSVVVGGTGAKGRVSRHAPYYSLALCSRHRDERRPRRRMRAAAPSSLATNARCYWSIVFTYV
ncbi:unnamed protein product [Spodoptera exigua]|nr:unnamed protein product [Spodoptera exigua]